MFYALENPDLHFLAHEIEKKLITKMQDILKNCYEYIHMVIQLLDKEINISGKTINILE